MRLRTSLIVLLAMLVAAPAAQAAKQRYAAPAPTGSGTACTQAAPCELKEAVGKAGAGDEVIVGPGTYPVEAEVVVPANVYVHGELSQPPPKITATLANAAINAPFPGAHIAYLEVSNTAGAAAGIECYLGVLIERVRVTVVGIASTGVQLQSDCMIRDSVLLASGMNSMAVVGSETIGFGAGSVRNLTAIATGSESIGVLATGSFFPGSSYTIDARNVIASGAKADLAASDGVGGGTGKILVSNSNFDSTKSTPSSKLVDEGSNQTAPPVFINAAGGDYREAAGSPTIDAGSTDHIGALDLGGNPRTVGKAPDIGAFEYVPPTPPPPPPGALQSLVLTPRAFRAAKAGGATFSKVKKAKAPIGTTVSYSLSAGGTVGFTVEKRLIVRKIGKCPNRAAKSSSKQQKGCIRRTILYKKVKGGFSHTGASGANTFKFSGRPNGKALPPGSYRLTGSAGGAVKQAPFKIVR